MLSIATLLIKQFGQAIGTAAALYVVRYFEKNKIVRYYRRKINAIKNEEESSFKPN